MAIVSFTMAEIKEKLRRGEGQTRDDAPEAEPLGEEFWENARIVRPSDFKFKA